MNTSELLHNRGMLKPAIRNASGLYGGFSGHWGDQLKVNDGWFERSSPSTTMGQWFVHHCPQIEQDFHHS